jgi:D-alanyl-D-alanine-carboxypeptidase/D-alanyl-D-alanine-endopeptidase
MAIIPMKPIFMLAACHSYKAVDFAFPLLLAMLALATNPIFAQPVPNVAGNYTGTLGPLHVKLHLNVDSAGAITGTLDSTDQGALGIPCADFHLNGQALTFSVPAVHGMWSGTRSMSTATA